MAPPSYDDSSTVNNTVTASRGLVRNSYHSSVRSHTGGRWAVAGWSCRLDDDAAGLHLGVPVEPRADQVAEVRPVVLGGGGTVDAHEPTAVADEALQCGAALVVEDRAAGAEERDHGEGGQFRRR